VKNRDRRGETRGIETDRERSSLQCEIGTAYIEMERERERERSEVQLALTKCAHQ
jgi:hypothetical protein